MSVEKLKELRKKLQMSQRHFAEISQVPLHIIKAYEDGDETHIQYQNKIKNCLTAFRL